MREPNTRGWLWNGTIWVPARGAPAAATLDETLNYGLQAAALYAYDGDDLSRLKVESATYPNLRAAIFSSAAELYLENTLTDDLAASRAGADVNSHLLGWGGTYWERWRNNIQATLLASLARNASTASADQTNYNGKGVIVVVNISAVAGDDTFTFTIQGKDPISSEYYGMLVSSALASTGIYVYILYPATTAGATGVISAPLPRTWRVAATYAQVGGAADTLTFSVSACVLN